MVADQPDCPPPPFPAGDPRYEKADYLFKSVSQRMDRLTAEAMFRPGWGVVFAVFAALVAGFFLGRME